MQVGVILYGAPASGKDTVTAALHQADQRYRLYRRLKSGPGRTSGYRMVEIDYLVHLASVGQVIWRNTRYDAVYVVDRPELERLIGAACIPVVHLGQVAAVDVITDSTPDVSWVVAELRCSPLRPNGGLTHDKQAILHGGLQCGTAPFSSNPASPTL